MAKTKERSIAFDEKRVQPQKEDLRIAAYYRWLSRGCPPGDDLTDWLEAEKEESQRTGWKWDR